MYKPLQQAIWKMVYDMRTWGVQSLPHNVTTYEAIQKTLWSVTNYAEDQVILLPRQIMVSYIPRP